MQTGGELITRILGDHDVGTVFSVAGASHSHLLKPLTKAGTTIISSRHEAGAVGAADGYARTAGKPGVALIVADQGLPNAVGALAVAWHAASPVLVIIATPPRKYLEAKRCIDNDQLALVTPITKWARTVPDCSRLQDYLHTALHHARSGRPGPVVLAVPQDQLQEECSARSQRTTPIEPVSAPDLQAIGAALAAIKKAQRPILIAGAGAAWAKASAPLNAIVKEFGIPILGNSLGRGQVAEDNQRSFSWPFAQVAANQADLVILVGARLTQRLGLGLPPRFSKDAVFIQIDIDATEFDRNRPIDIPICADAAAATAALLDALRDAKTASFSADWIHDALVARRNRVAELLNSKDEEIHPLQLGQAIQDRMTHDMQVVGDGADIQNWMYGVVTIERPQGFLDHYPMGAMGSCTALAVGSAAAHRENLGDAAPLTILITGDGAIGFHPAEIHAAVRAGLRLLVIVGNDGAWGTELHEQQESIGATFNTELGVLPYEHLGLAFGANGIVIRQRGELEEKLDEAFAQSGVTVVNVEIDRTAGREIKTNRNVRMIEFSDILDGQSQFEQ